VNQDRVQVMRVFQIAHGGEGDVQDPVYVAVSLCIWGSDTKRFETEAVNTTRSPARCGPENQFFLRFRPITATRRAESGLPGCRSDPAPADERGRKSRWIITGDTKSKLCLVLDVLLAGFVVDILRSGEDWWK